MRQITITGPEGTAKKIAEIAFSAGILQVAVSSKRVLEANGSAYLKDCIEVEVGTPLAKTFLDRLTSQAFFTRAEYSIAVRQPRALSSRERLSDLTVPLVEPTIDIFEELWQFSQVTYGFVGRILIGGLLLAYGLVEFKFLFMIAGLLFIPLLPLMLSIGFGLWTRQWRLVLQGTISLVAALLLLIAAGAVVGLMTSPPVRYAEFNSGMTGLLVSCAVGIAAGLATADDVGRREMISLAGCYRTSGHRSRLVGVVFNAGLSDRRAAFSGNRGTTREYRGSRGGFIDHLRFDWHQACCLSLLQERSIRMV